MSFRQKEVGDVPERLILVCVCVSVFVCVCVRALCVCLNMLALVFNELKQLIFTPTNSIILFGRFELYRERVRCIPVDD